MPSNTERVSRVMLKARWIYLKHSERDSHCPDDNQVLLKERPHASTAVAIVDHLIGYLRYTNAVHSRGIGAVA